VPGAVDVAGARWSHDGEWLAYQETAASGSGQLHVVRADGSRAHGIGAPGEIRTWAWSPTADVIAYIRGTATVSTTASVELVDANGGAATVVAASVRAYDVPWSPEGTRVAYVEYAGGQPSIDRLFVANVGWCAQACGSAATEIPLI
jgi:Tol biopolymer transport system component